MESSVMLAYVADQLGASSLLDAIELTGGSSATVHRLDLAAADTRPARSVVFRQHRSVDFFGRNKSVAHKEFELLLALHHHGLAVARPLLHDREAGWLVTEWIDGSTAVAADEVASAVDQMAGFLAELHRLDTRALDVDGLAPIEDPRVGVLPFLPDTDLGERVAATLRRAPMPDQNQQSLIHGDYWPGNVLWRDRQLAAVIDWEDAHTGDPVADLAGARVELFCEYGAATMTAFTNTYRSEAGVSLQHSLPIWEVYVSATALASMHLWRLDACEEERRRRLTSDFFTRAAHELLDRFG